jgi:hypothetical protein
MSQRLPSLVAFVLMCSFAGCSTVQFKKDQLAATTRLAVIGFSGSVEIPDEGGAKNKVGSLLNAVKTSKDVLSGSSETRRVEQGERVYDTLVRRLQEGTGWTVVPRETLKNDEEYQNVLKRAAGRPGVHDGGFQRPKEVMRDDFVKELEPAGRKELMQRLGVDAVAVARVRYVKGGTSGVSIGGFGKTSVYPKAIASLTVYDASGSAIWEEQWAEGKPSSLGLSNTMGVESTTNETAAFSEAASSAFDVMLDRYKKRE